MSSPAGTSGDLRRLQQIGAKIWIADGPVVDFFSFPYPTRMVIVQLRDHTSWIWSPIEASDSLVEEVISTAGPVRYLISPNKIHWIFLRQWQERFPEAKLCALPGLMQRDVVKQQNLKFDITLSDDETDPAYAADIDQVLFRGGVMDEVVFFHRVSKTCIVCDLIQRFPVDFFDDCRWKGWLMKVDGMVGPSGMAPGEWRFCFWAFGLLPTARDSLNKILHDWQPRRLVIAHGENAINNGDATEVIANCFRWIPDEREDGRCCGWCPCNKPNHRDDGDGSREKQD